jgi:hypothetical protein
MSSVWEETDEAVKTAVIKREVKKRSSILWMRLGELRKESRPTDIVLGRLVERQFAKRPRVSFRTPEGHQVFLAVGCRAAVKLDKADISKRAIHLVPLVGFKARGREFPEEHNAIATE